MPFYRMQLFPDFVFGAIVKIQKKKYFHLYTLFYINHHRRRFGGEVFFGIVISANVLAIKYYP
jgi:hypothetical protein